jgi:RimJ/RimL family protein N-acetyltransferase
MPDPLRFPVPTELLTERLLLRPFRQEDAPVLHAAIAESIGELRQHLWFLPWVAEEPSLESALVRCRQAEAAFLLRTDLPFLAFNRGTGRLVASIGLHRTDWNIPRTEVGYWVRTGEKGNGYASEGVNALTKWALGQLRAIRVELITDEQNTGSRAVAARCGFMLEGIHRNIGRGPDGAVRHNCIYARY